MKYVLTDVAWGVVGLLLLPIRLLEWLGASTSAWWARHSQYRYYFGHQMGEVQDGFELVAVDKDVLNGEIVMIWKEDPRGRTQY